MRSLNAPGISGDKYEQTVKTRGSVKASPKPTYLRLGVQGDDLLVMVQQFAGVGDVNGCLLLVTGENPDLQACLSQFRDGFGDSILQAVFNPSGTCAKVCAMVCMRPLLTGPPTPERGPAPHPSNSKTFMGGTAPAAWGLCEAWPPVLSAHTDRKSLWEHTLWSALRGGGGRLCKLSGGNSGRRAWGTMVVTACTSFFPMQA